MIERPLLNLDYYHEKFVRGEFTVYHTWAHYDDDEEEPCIVIVPTFRALAGGAVRPAVIALSSAFKYRSDAYLMKSATHIAEGLGLGPSSTYPIARSIGDGLLDLINIPIKPVLGTKVVADAIVTTESGKKHHIEMTEDF